MDGHSSDADGSPPRSNVLDDAGVRNDCRIAEFAVVIAPIRGRRFLILRSLSSSVKDRALQQQGAERKERGLGLMWIEINVRITVDERSSSTLSKLSRFVSSWAETLGVISPQILCALYSPCINFRALQSAGHKTHLKLAFIF